MLSFRKTPVAIKFFDKRVRGGEGRLYLEKFLCHSDENARMGSFLCCVQETSRKRKGLWIREGESTFSVENILSQSAKKYRRINLLCCVSEKLQ